MNLGGLAAEPALTLIELMLIVVVGAFGVSSMNSIHSGACRPGKAQVFGCRAVLS